MNANNNVLLVEDNAADVKLTQLAFENQSIKSTIVHCADGKFALEKLRETSVEIFDYILLDLNMPRLNGIEFLQICKTDSNLKNLPVIVFTTSANINDIERCYELGANAYVQKPVDLSDFDRTIDAINSFWGGINIRANFS